MDIVWVLWVRLDTWTMLRVSLHGHCVGIIGK